MIVKFMIPVAEIDCPHSEKEGEKQKANDKYSQILSRHLDWLKTLGTIYAIKDVKQQSVQGITSDNKLSSVIYYQATVSIMVGVDTNKKKDKYFGDFEFEGDI